MYNNAKLEYQKLGVDTEKAIETLSKIPVSLHCWQGDDVMGFDNDGGLSGGIQTTGNYLGKARNPEELFQDMEKVLTLVPGTKKINVSNIIAMFESTLSRSFGIGVNELTYDIFVLEIYYYDIAQDLILNGFDYNGKHYVYFSSSYPITYDVLQRGQMESTVAESWHTVRGMFTEIIFEYIPDCIVHIIDRDGQTLGKYMMGSDLSHPDILFDIAEKPY
jgi:hypothetical protein